MILNIEKLVLGRWWEGTSQVRCGWKDFWKGWERTLATVAKCKVCPSAAFKAAVKETGELEGNLRLEPP